MKNTICIDLTQFNNEELTELSKIHNLDAHAVIENKNKGIGKIWMDLDFNTMSAYSLKDTKDDIIMTDFYKEALSKVSPVQLPIKPMSVQVLDIDAILEKITQSGMDSLSDEELEYLNKQK